MTVRHKSTQHAALAIKFECAADALLEGFMAHSQFALRLRRIEIEKSRCHVEHGHVEEL